MEKKKTEPECETSLQVNQGGKGVTSEHCLVVFVRIRAVTRNVLVRHKKDGLRLDLQCRKGGEKKKRV